MRIQDLPWVPDLSLNDRQRVDFSDLSPETLLLSLETLTWSGTLKVSSQEHDVDLGFLKGVMISASSSRLDPMLHRFGVRRASPQGKTSLQADLKAMALALGAREGTAELSSLSDPPEELSEHGVRPSELLGVIYELLFETHLDQCSWFSQVSLANTGEDWLLTLLRLRRSGKRLQIDVRVNEDIHRLEILDGQPALSSLTAQAYRRVLRQVFPSTEKPSLANFSQGTTAAPEHFSTLTTLSHEEKERLQRLLLWDSIFLAHVEHPFIPMLLSLVHQKPLNEGQVSRQSRHTSWDAIARLCRKCRIAYNGRTHKKCPRCVKPKSSSSALTGWPAVAAVWTLLVVYGISIFRGPPSQRPAPPISGGQARISTPSKTPSASAPTSEEPQDPDAVISPALLNYGMPAPQSASAPTTYSVPPLFRLLPAVPPKYLRETGPRVMIRVSSPSAVQEVIGVWIFPDNSEWIIVMEELQAGLWAGVPPDDPEWKLAAVVFRARNAAGGVNQSPRYFAPQVTFHPKVTAPQAPEAQAAQASTATP